MNDHLIRANPVRIMELQQCYPLALSSYWAISRKVPRTSSWKSSAKPPFGRFRLTRGRKFDTLKEDKSCLMKEDR